MKNRIANIADGVLIVAAVVVVGLMIRRDFFAAAKEPGDAPELIANWTDMLSAGIWSGPRDAPIKVVEFADVECPACAARNPQLEQWQQTYGEHIAIILIHFPLPRHRFAELGARAVECADDSGHAMAMVQAIYKKQDSLGIKSWSSYASDAGIAQGDSLQSCVQGSRDFPRIAAGKEWGERIAVTGTPTIIINGWRAVSGADLDEWMKQIADGNAPVKKYRKKTY